MVLERARDEEIMMKNSLSAVDEEIESQQDVEMGMELDPMTGEEIEIEQDMEDSTSGGEEMPGRDTLAIGPQARDQSKDIEHDQDEENQVAILLESGEAESATGKRNCKALEAMKH